MLHAVRTGPVSRRSAVGAGRPAARAMVVVRVKPPTSNKQLSKKIEEALSEAEETCSDEKAVKECAVAWDHVEELSHAAANRKDPEGAGAYKDPLEAYCEDNADADECRVYDN